MKFRDTLITKQTPNKVVPVLIRKLQRFGVRCCGVAKSYIHAAMTRIEKFLVYGKVVAECSNYRHQNFSQRIEHSVTMLRIDTN